MTPPRVEFYLTKISETWDIRESGHKEKFPRHSKPLGGFPSRLADPVWPIAPQCGNEISARLSRISALFDARGLAMHLLFLKAGFAITAGAILAAVVANALEFWK